MDSSRISESACECSESTPPPLEEPQPECECPRNELEMVEHQETCLLYKNETFTLPPIPTVCDCCLCPRYKCTCGRAGSEALAEYRTSQAMKSMPTVLEPTHPLMQRFQDSLKRFLERENALAADEILNLRTQLNESKALYESELAEIYRNDHDTNEQRTLIVEYEETVKKATEDRLAAEKRAQTSNEMYKKAKEHLDKDSMTEREAAEELEALSSLVRQLNLWRTETESDLTISQHVSDKMRKEKKALADEKRQLDMFIYALTNEIWRLESRLDMFHKQINIKNNEMEKVNDRVTAYATEMEDLDLDQRRLMSLWNSALINIRQRDRVYDSVKEDYKILQDNYSTLAQNLMITKKMLVDEINHSKDLMMTKEKMQYDLDHATKHFEEQDKRRIELETQIMELTEAIEMNERDEDMIKSENKAMRSILSTTSNDLEQKSQKKVKLETEILANLQECLLNDKAVESLANGINKMRDLSRKQELMLTTTENSHAKLLYDIDLLHLKQARRMKFLQEELKKMHDKDKYLDDLETKFNLRTQQLNKKQREYDIIIQKYQNMVELFHGKSPQERRIDELTSQIRTVRERVEQQQYEWLRLQGHVVKLSSHYHRLTADCNLSKTQLTICQQKSMRVQTECENLMAERTAVERELRDMRGHLAVLQKTRKQYVEDNDRAQTNHAIMTYEFSLNLKDAEADIIQVEEDVEKYEAEKLALTQDLDRIHKQVLIWERKGVMAVELKRNIHNAKSAAGEIGMMKTEIHRMEVRNEQLRKTGEKLSEDLAMCVTRREIAADKARSSEQQAAGVAPSVYTHRLRLARADVARVAKQLEEVRNRLEELDVEQQRLQQGIADTDVANRALEENVARLLRACRKGEVQKQWVLERVIRTQRLGTALATALKRERIRVKKPKSSVLSDYEHAKELNETLAGMVRKLANEFVHLEDKWEAIGNTLNIYSPDEEPPLTGPCECTTEEQVDENVAEKPLSP